MNWEIQNNGGVSILCGLKNQRELDICRGIFGSPAQSLAWETSFASYSLLICILFHFYHVEC